MTTKDHILIHLALLSGSIWGVLGRKGLTVLTNYDGAISDSALWANFAACFVLASVSGLPKTPFIVGVSTGFCGTLSSFSAVILDLYEKAANVVSGERYNYPNAGYGVMEFLSILIVELAVSIFGFILGKHISKRVERLLPKKNHSTLAYVSAIVGIAAYIVVIVLASTKKSWRTWSLMVIFAPFGAFIRYHLSKLNAAKRFPLGTYLANVGACITIAIFTLLSRGRSSNSTGQLVSSIISCQVLLALIDGFCGTLSTVSTFISELFTLPRATAYTYCIISITTNFCLVVVILGSYTWTLGLTTPTCTY